MSESKQVGKLDAQCALDHSRQIRQYLDRFNGQSFGVTENSVDRRNLGVALDNLEETAAMLMNMSNRVIELEAAVLSASAGENKDDFEVVGKIVFDKNFGWHTRVTKPWDELGNGTILYASKSNQDQSTNKDALA